MSNAGQLDRLSWKPDWFDSNRRREDVRLEFVTIFSLPTGPNKRNREIVLTAICTFQLAKHFFWPRCKFNRVLAFQFSRICDYLATRAKCCCSNEKTFSTVKKTKRWRWMKGDLEIRAIWYSNSNSAIWIGLANQTVGLSEFSSYMPP